MIKCVVSKQCLQRLSQYLEHLLSLKNSGEENISATKIANSLNLNHVVVRKDLASISNSGKPKVGYNKLELIKELETFLGYRDSKDAIIIGAGRLGQALLCYEGFNARGFNILAAFDINSEIIQESLPNKKVFPMNKIISFCERTKVHIGIITVPEEYAQAVANLLVECGILAIWNFTSVRLIVPDGVLVHNENMVASMALLSQHLSDKLSGNK